MQNMATDLVPIPFSISAKVHTIFDTKSGERHGTSQTWQVPDPVSDLMSGLTPGNYQMALGPIAASQRTASKATGGMGEA